jgi:hypothetical protein
MTKKQFLTFVEQLKDKGLHVNLSLTPEQLAALKAKLEKKFGDLKDVIDLSKIDDKIIEFAVKVGIVKLYKIGEHKFAKISAWFNKVLAMFDKEELETLWDSILKKFTGE